MEERQPSRSAHLLRMDQHGEWHTHLSRWEKRLEKRRKKETTYWTLPQQLLYTEHVTTFHWLDFPFLFLRRFKFQTKRPNWAVGGRPGVTVWLQIGWFFFFSTLSISSQPSSFKKKRKEKTHTGAQADSSKGYARTQTHSTLSLLFLPRDKQRMIHIYTQQHINDDSIFCLYLYFFPFVCIAFFLSLYLASITLSYYVLKQMPDGSCRYIRIVYYAILQFSFLLLFFLVLYVVAYSRHIRIVCYDMGTGAFRSSVGTLTGAYDSLAVVVRFSFL